MSTITDIIGLFPWLSRLEGLLPEIEEALTEGASDAEIVARIRGSAAYAKRFPAMRNNDGSLRFSSESSYLDEERRLKDVLQRWGAKPGLRNNPHDFATFMEQGIDSQELDQRFTLRDQVTTHGRDVQDAFYVYAGLRIGQDRLYEALVNPEEAERLAADYQQRLSLQNNDFATFIERVSEVTVERTSDLIQELAEEGVLNARATRILQDADPASVQRLVGRIALGNQGQMLTVPEITRAFQYAMIGGAREEAGLSGLPSEDRIQEFIDAGVDRAKALEGFSNIARNRREWRSFASRANIDVSKRDLEDSVLMGRDTNLQDVMQREQSLGQRTGSSRFDQTRSGRLTQSGLGKA